MHSILKSLNNTLLISLIALTLCTILLLPSIVSANLKNRTDISNLSTLRLVHAIFRHGERNPVSSYVPDPYNNLSYWPEGLGELTKRGRLQQFQLGQYIRKRFKGFISHIYNEKEVFVQTSEYNRTIISAHAVLAGLYGQPENDRVWPHFNINIITSQEDKTIRVSHTCPQYVKLYSDFHVHSNIMKKYNKDNKEIFEIINDNTGLNFTYVTPKLLYLINTLIIKKERNFTFSSWEDSLYNSGRLKEIVNFYHLSLGYTTEMKRLRAGPLLKEIFQNINKATEHGNQYKENAETKMYLYSGHDVTVTDLLNAFGLYDVKNFVGYSSTVFLELHQLHQSSTFYFRIFYRNDSNDDASELQIPNCPFPCEVNFLHKNIKQMIPEDWDQECKSTANSSAQPEYTQFNMLIALLYGLQIWFNLGI